MFRHQVFLGGGGGGLGACSPRIKLKINIAGNALKLFFLPSHNFKSLGRPFWLLAGGGGGIGLIDSNFINFVVHIVCYKLRNN